jgi:hypothetical protein
MKKPINLWLAVLLMILLALSTIAQARTGSSSSSSSKSSSSKSAGSSSSRSSSSSSLHFFSKPSKTTSSTDSAFSSAAKSNQARAAWQERNKVNTPPPVSSTLPPPVNLPVPSGATTPRPDYSSNDQVSAIQKQLSDIKRQQQLIAIGQTAAQWALSNRNSPPAPTTTAPVANNVVTTTTPSTLAPVTQTTPMATTPNTPVSDSTSPNKSDEGMSWFTIVLLIGGAVWLVFWLKKRATPTTIYRL